MSRLDSLRAHLQSLTTYELEGAPWRYRWGLYRGSALYPRIWQTYSEGLEEVILSQTRASLVDALREFLASGGRGSTNRAYDLLKAYLMTTSFPDKRSPGFLSPILQERWLADRNADPEPLRLARQQLDFYGSDLARGELCSSFQLPCSREDDVGMVSRTRELLSDAFGGDQVYGAMLGVASSDHDPIQFRSRTVVSAHEVPGAFTKGGWESMQEAFSNPDRFLTGESWVLGREGPVIENKWELVHQIREKYVREYIGHWRDFLTTASVSQFTDYQDAAAKLDDLSGNESPLLKLLLLASQNTAVDSESVESVFQPLHAVTPPDTTDKFIGETNQEYIKSLNALKRAVDQVATAPPGQGDPNAALDQARNAKGAVDALALTFDVQGGAAPIGRAVQQLLEAPIVAAEHLLGSYGASQLNRAGSDFCRQYDPLMRKYPFTRGARQEATMDEVIAIFGRPDGSLWTFYQDRLEASVTPQGAAKPGAEIRPTSTFVRFFRHAIAFSSDILGSQDGATPQIRFTLRPQVPQGYESIAIRIDGQGQPVTPTSIRTQTFRWNGPSATSVRVTGQTGGREIELFEEKGPWAVFRLFKQASWQSEGAGSAIVTWLFPPPQGERVTVTADYSGPDVFKASYFNSFLTQCVSGVAQ